MSQRANKCTNGKRLTFEECRKMYVDETIHFYSVEVADVFSNLGTVGAFIINGKNLELFVLSCRALGRGVEELMIKEIEKHDIANIYFDYNNKNGDLKEKLNKLISN